jgi:hypothetical protein
LVDGGEQRLSGRHERGLTEPARRDLPDHGVKHGRLAVEEQLFLRAHVGEDRLDRDVGGVRDLRDGDAREPALSEQAIGGGENRLPGQPFLPLSEPLRLGRDIGLGRTDRTNQVIR